MAFRLAWRVLRSCLDRHQINAIERVLEREGVLYGCRIDPNPEGIGFRLRPHNPQMLAVISCNFSEVGGVWGREPPGQSAELLLFVDRYEFSRCVEGAGGEGKGNG